MKLNKLFFGAAALVAMLASCARQEVNTPKDTRAIRFSASVGSYQSKATDNAFEKGDAVGLIADAPLNIVNAKLVWDGSALVPEQEITWGAVENNTRVQFYAYYPYQSSLNADNTLTFTVNPDQTTHAKYTASDLMGARTAAAPADGEVHFSFRHLLTKVVFTIENNLGVDIDEVFMSNVYGQVVAAPGQEPVVDGKTGTIKAGKVTVNGKEAWALVLAPGKTQPKIIITTKDGKQYTYTADVEVNFQGGSRYGASIVLNENSISTDFTSDIVEWTDNGDIQFGQGGEPGDVEAFELDWTVRYLGCQWIEGLYSKGQIEVLEVSNTDVEKFYNVSLFNLSDEEEAEEAAWFAEDPEGYIEALQENIDATLEAYSSYYGYTFEELVPLLFYNEENDGSEMLFYGQPAGSYTFVLLSMDEKGQLDGGYKVVSFNKEVDALQIYDWGVNYQENEAYTAAYDGWIDGYEGSYYYVVGQAPGAAYVIVDSYNDDELDYFYDGNVKDLLDYTQSSIKDNMAAGYTMDDMGFEVDEDGAFDAYLSTYGLTGLTNIYVIAFDADGNILASYGKSEVDIPESQPDPIEWVEKADWAINYDAEADTENTEYPQALVTTACDAGYFITAVMNAGTLEEYGLDVIGEYLMSSSGVPGVYYDYGYTFEELVEYDVIHSAVPSLDAYSGLENGLEAYIFGIDENGLTGEWHMEIIDGIEEIVLEPVEPVLQSDWSVELDGEPFNYGNYTYCYVKVNAPGIKYFWLEENTDEDLEYYYGGSVATLLEAYQEDLAKEVAQGTPIDELIFSGEDEDAYFVVWNPGAQTSIYLMEFDEKGMATGRYSKTDLFIPEPEEEEEAVPALAPKCNKASLKGKVTAKPFKAQLSCKQAARPALQPKVRKAVKVENFKSVTRQAVAVKADQKVLNAKKFQLK